MITIRKEQLGQARVFQSEVANPWRLLDQYCDDETAASIGGAGVQETVKPKARRSKNARMDALLEGCPAMALVRAQG